MTLDFRGLDTLTLTQCCLTSPWGSLKTPTLLPKHCPTPEVQQGWRDAGSSQPPWAGWGTVHWSAKWQSCAGTLCFLHSALRFSFPQWGHRFEKKTKHYILTLLHNLVMLVRYICCFVAHQTERNKNKMLEQWVKSELDVTALGECITGLLTLQRGNSRNPPLSQKCKNLQVHFQARDLIMRGEICTAGGL